MTRSAAEIGAGLAPARPARPIEPDERIHVVGIAGAGASAAALLASAAGASVDGCDPGGPSPYTPAVEAAGIPIRWEHRADHVDARAGRLAVTKALTAIDPDHPELVAARTHGVPVEPWQQVVADAASDRVLVGVAGTHGKSTTSGWLVHVLTAAGRDPSAFVGALLPSTAPDGIRSTARWGSGPEFVVEADEYAGNFDPYRPEVAVLTSVEWDHPDVFADLGDVVRAFETWLRTAAGAAPSRGKGSGPVLVANVRDPGVVRLVDRLAGWGGSVLEVALTAAEGSLAEDLDARVAASSAVPPQRLAGTIVSADADGTSLRLSGDLLATPLDVRLPTAGRHNAANALCVAGAALTLGVAPEAVAAGLASFPGVGRRLERKGEARGVVVYDDYGHHPTAIRETLAAVRQREPGRRIWAVYEPLTYHRTAALLDDFAAALAAADGVAIADIWAGRDPDTTIASSARLADAVRARRSGLVAEATGSPEATGAWLASHVRRGDAVLVMGGGRSYRIGEVLLERLGGSS